MSRTIDWSSAPEWANVVIAASLGTMYWAEQYGGRSRCIRVQRRQPGVEAAANMTGDHKWTLVESRPIETVEPASWNGEGLPPVGMVCEDGIPHISGPGGETRCVIWIEGCVVAYHDIKGKTYAWFAEDDGFYPPGMFEFRPIKTAEQIAAEERSAAIDEMVKTFYQGNTVVGGADGFIALYNAGYRKVEQP